jgi:oligoendopeptidase F
MGMTITTTPDVPVPALRFVPAGFDAVRLADVRVLVQQLLERPLTSGADLEAWILDWHEVVAQVYAARSRRHIAMTRDTVDEDVRRAHLDFETEIWPEWQRLEDQLQHRYLESEWRSELGSRYTMFDKRITNTATLFRKQNVGLLAHDQELQAQYARMCGMREVEFRGEKLTPQQCFPYLEESDRATRKDAYEAMVAAVARDAEATEALLDEMLELRTRIAQNADLPDFRAYRFREMERFDYEPADCFVFHDAIEAVAVPAVRERMELRRQRLGLDTLRPYDFHAHPFPELRPFSDEPGLIAIGRALFGAVDPVFDKEFDILVRNGLLDLMTRPGKAPGGYNAGVADIRLPFIFANAAGGQRDIQTLVHEGGHAFHTLATRNEPVLPLARAPVEFCEVASMAMELFSLEHFGEVYDPQDARAAAAHMLELRLWIFTWVATVDAFQHWLYTHPGHSRAERAQTWVELRGRFAPYFDWSGCEAARATEWHRQLHIFKYPFYYIDYGLAALGALQVWRNYRSDPAAAVAAYRGALALGGSRPLPELFAASGARFAMDEASLREVVDDAMARLRELDE